MEINEGPISMVELMARIKARVEKTAQDESKLKRLKNTQPWQELALELIKGLKDGNNKQGSIFRCCKLNSNAAKIAWEDCKELDKKYVMYFLKVWSILYKKQK